MAHEVERDSFVHLCPYNSPHTLRASCIHRWTAHRTRRLALTRAPPPLSLRAQRVTPHGPVEHHALRHSIEKQSSRGRRAQQHEQQLQQQQPFRSWWSMVAAAGGATNPRTTRTPAPPPGARLLNPNPNPSPDPSQVVRRHPALVFLHSGASDFTERYAETCPHPHPYPHPRPHPDPCSRPLPAVAATLPQGADRARAIGACGGCHPQRHVGEEYPGETQYAATIHYDPPRPTRLTMIHHAPPRPTTLHQVGSSRRWAAPRRPNGAHRAPSTARATADARRTFGVAVGGGRRGATGPPYRRSCGGRCRGERSA